MKKSVDAGAELGTIKVDYRVADIVAMQLAAWRFWLRPALFPFVLVFLLSLIPVATGDETFRAAFTSIDWSLAAILSIMLVGALMLAAVLGYAIRRFRGKHNDILLGLAEIGIVVRGPEGEGTMFWKSLKRVSSNDKRLMLFIASNSALIVPRRCFSDAATFKRWIDFSTAHWLAAKSRDR